MFKDKLWTRPIAAVLLSLGLIIGMTGCGKNESVKEQSSNPYVQTEKEDDSDSTDGQIVTDETQIKAMASAIMKKMTLEEKLGQMFIVNLEQLDTGKGDYYEYRKATKTMKQSLEELPVGGVILFARNIEMVDQTKKMITDLQGSSKIPMFISVDEEGGDVARIGNNSNMNTTTFPPMEEVGEKKDEAYAYDMGVTIAKDIKELGFNLDFAPVADVKTNAENKEIGNRAFGSDADLVSDMVEQVTLGIQSQGISATLKHFPGHGSVSEDTHQAPVNAETDLMTLRETEFKPFKAGIDAGADFVMVSHISISKVTGDTEPASMSETAIQKMLRDELHFEGVVITDALDMGAITTAYEPGEAAVNCIKAGEDMLLMSTDFKEAYKALFDAVINGEIAESQIDESVMRILMVKLRRGLILENTDLLAEESQ